MRSTLLPLFFCLSVLPGAAQYGAGLAGGTYEGVWGVGGQPASILLNTDRCEINVLRLGVDIDNSLVRLGRSEFGLFGFERRIRVDTTDAVKAINGSASRGIGVDIRCMLPSFSLRLGERSALAFSNGLRVSVTALDLEQLARKLGVDTIDLDPGAVRRLEEVDLRAAGTSWSEHGLTYARTVDLGTRVRLHGAATVKYLLGAYGLYVKNEAPLLTAVNDSVDVVSDVNAEYGIVQPQADPFKDGLRGLFNGHGWGGDLGFVVEFLRNADGESHDHWLRIGAALTDLGSINFNKRTEAHRIEGGSATLDEITALRIERTDQVGSAISDLFLKDPSQSLQARSFRMDLPTAAHLSVDYAPVPHVAIRVEGVLGLTEPIRATSVRDQLAVVPRYETRNFAISVPVTVDRFRQTSVGACVRIAGFMIGSDRIGGLFGLNDVRGADLYLGMKVRIKGKAKTA